MVAKQITERVFRSSGIDFDGYRNFDIRVTDQRFYRHVLTRGSLGLGEAYMEGWWECDDLEELLYRLILGRAHPSSRLVPAHLAMRVAAGAINRQARAPRVNVRHYNLGNDVFTSFLGRYKNYSSGYYNGSDDLDAAQRNKLELIARKLQLQPGEHVLDVGGGWGEFARYAAEVHGCRVTSINISTAQIAYAREQCEGLPVEIIERDYRNVTGTYDKIAAIAMIAHVGPKNHRGFFEVLHDRLAPDGLLLVETIGSNSSKSNTDAWLDRYIFPNLVFPSLTQLSGAAEGLFAIEDVHNFPESYIRTLHAWRDNLEAAWPNLVEQHGEQTRRMFQYFFALAVAAFRTRWLQHWQLVLTRTARPVADYR